MTGFRELLASGLRLPPEERRLLPSGFQRIGDILLVRLPTGLEPRESAIGSFLLDRCGAAAVYAKGPVTGELRIPRLKRIAGRKRITIHRENGCLFSLDVPRLMFSQGNVLERGRLRAAPGETVVDLFAGIGYFTIPLAKRTPDCRVIAVEKNPVAARFLKRNISLNRLGNVSVVHGDCRQAGLRGIADRVVMGYLPRTERFLPTAFAALKQRGTIHFHNLYARDNLWRKPRRQLARAAGRAGFRIAAVHHRVVKSYSPSRAHVVLDVEVSGA